MKTISFKIEEIVPSLAMASQVVSIKNALPILSNVRIKTKDDGIGGSYIELTTSDSETWLQVKSTCYNTTNDIALCIDAKALLQALRNLDVDVVVMNVDEERHVCIFTYQNGKFQLPYEDASNYPMPTSTEETFITKHVNAKQYLNAIEKAGFATASDELRPVMNGVRFDFCQDGMISVASDGHKLAKYKDLSITSTESEKQGFTLDKKPCHTLMNILANMGDCDVTIEFNESVVSIRNEHFYMTTRLIEGRYPNYDSVIPKNNDITALVSKAKITSALKRVLPMGSATSELVVVKLENGNMTIKAEDFDFSKLASETIECDYVGDEFSIGFKGSTLLQLIQNLNGDNVKMLLKENTRPCVLTEENNNGSYEYTSLIMPMLIN